MWNVTDYIEQKTGEGRKIYIWGMGRNCRYFIYSFREKGYRISAIIDSKAVSRNEHYFKNYPIISSEEFFRLNEKCFVIIMNEKEGVQEELIKHGLIEGFDFILFSKIILYGFGDRREKKEIEKPLINQMDVKITYACNFRCEYCYQADEDGNHEARFLSKENAENLVKFAERMNDVFYITLAGGEPFVYPHLQYLVEELTRLGNHISLITNFTASYEKIKAIILAAREKLATFNLSIHLSQWKDMQEFFNKLRRVLHLLEEEGIPLTIRTTCVLTEQNFEKLLQTDQIMRKEFPEVPFEIQRVYHNNIYEIYNEKIEDFLKKRGLDVPEEEANKIDFYGHMCWSGAKFFYIEVDGEVRRCYTNQFNKGSYKLGNLSEVDQIISYKEAMPCMSIHGGDCICYSNFVNLKMISDQLATREEISRFYKEY